MTSKVEDLLYFRAYIQLRSPSIQNWAVNRLAASVSWHFLCEVCFHYYICHRVAVGELSDLL